MDGTIPKKMYESYINSCCLKEVDEKKYVAHDRNIIGNLKKEYSSEHGKEHDKALLALLSIHITDDNAILDFCWKYGRLGLTDITKPNFPNSWNERRTKFGSFDNCDDWMVCDQTDTKSTPYYNDYESLDLYRAVISSFQRCSNLRSALNEKNLKMSVELTCYLLDFLYIPGDGDVSDLVENLLAYLGLTPKYYKIDGKVAAPWSDNYLDGTISFNFDLDSILQKLSADRIDQVLNLCQYVLSFWVSEEIGNIRLYMSPDYINRSFTASTSVSNMYKFLWYIMFLMFTNNQIIRECASSTCYVYFPIRGNNKRKIYCDIPCANIEAKRAERKRNREKKGT